MRELPTTWEEVGLFEIASLIRGVTYSKSDASDTAKNGFIPVLRATNITDRGFNLKDLVYVPTKFVTDVQRIKKGDVVVATSSGSISVVGKAVQSQSDLDAGFGAFCGLLRPIPQIDSRFFGHYFTSEKYRSAVSSMARGVNINNLKREHFESILLPLAPLNEQKRIADKLDSLLAQVDACRERLDRVPQVLKRFRQAVLAAATSGGLTAEWREKNSGCVGAKQGSSASPAFDLRGKKGEAGEAFASPLQDRGEGEDLPEGWQYIELTEVADSFSYGTSAKSAKTGKIPVLRMGNIQNGQLDWDDLVFTSDSSEIKKYRLQAGDVLFNRTNSPELVGKTAVFKGEQDAIYAGYLIRVRCGESLLPDYLNYCLNSPAGRDYCWEVKSDGVSQSNINAKKLAAFFFPLPSLPEQHEIVRRVETLFAFADRLEARYSAARKQVDQLTPSLLAKAFRGELMPQDPNDEPAEKLLERIRTSQVTCGGTETKARRRKTPVQKREPS